MSEIKLDKHRYKQFQLHSLLVIIFLLICRLIANYIIPLNDSTEARYGEIARKMLETGNWVTPQHDYGVPFWAKPPLSTWLSALSMKLFGVNEFAARFPALLLSIAIIWLVWDLAKKQSGSVAGTLSALVLSGTLYFFLDAGAVMTDPALLFCTSLSVVSFWHAMLGRHQVWSYLFFVGLGLGLLAKGPIAIILVGVPLFLWVVLRRQWQALWKQLPWIKGSLLVLAIALPWYVLAELRTPGFLNYFITGEHIQRFLTPGWTGDKYGMAHDEPKGMIWIYALAGIFPWNILALFWLRRHGKKLPSFFPDADGYMSYLFLCMIGPLLFFTFSSNIIYPYVFSSLPAFALFFVELWRRSSGSIEQSQYIIRCSMICGVLFCMATMVFVIKPNWVAKTQKPIVTVWKDQHPRSGSDLIYWELNSEFSAQFYSAGKVVATRSQKELCQLLAKDKDNYLVINTQYIPEVVSELFSKFTVIEKQTFRNNTLLLVHCPVRSCEGIDPLKLT